jgi:hypothetical protein
MLRPRHPPVQGRGEARPRRPPALGRGRHHRPARRAQGGGGSPRPRRNRPGPETLLGLEERYDQAISTGIIHNRLRDWHDGNHPGYALGRWLRDYPRPLVPHKLPRLRRRPRPHLAGSHYRRALSGRPWLPAVPAAARPASQ